MTPGRQTLILTGAVVAAFASLYAGLGWLVATRFLLPLTLVEGVVLSTQVLRTGVVFALPRLRNASPFTIMDVLSLEAFVFPFLGLLGWATGNGAYRDLGLQVIFGWTASLILLSPSVMVYKFARSMYHGGSLAGLMPSAAVIFGVLGSIQGLPSPPPGASGPSALYGDLLGAFTGPNPAPPAVTSPLLGVAGVVAFFALVVYASAGFRGPRLSQVPVLAVALAGVAGAMAWEAAASQLTLSSLLLFTLPTAAVGGSLWWVTSEAKR